MEPNKIRKNPSRATCEAAIKRILMTEVLQYGSNKHFRNATDFMSYFESLYPASDALTKQVQRAIKSLDMPKDDRGYFIVNKTNNQFEQEKEITHLFEVGHACVHPMDTCEMVFLQVDASVRSYIVHTLNTSETFRDKFVTMVEASNGLIIYTENKNQLTILLNSLIKQV